MIKNFLAYDLALNLYRQVQTIESPAHTKDQLQRAAQSIVLNLAEGSGKPTPKEKRRFYAIAFGSVREVQACFAILEIQDKALLDKVDHVAAVTYRLAYS